MLLLMCAGFSLCLENELFHGGVSHERGVHSFKLSLLPRTRELVTLAFLAVSLYIPCWKEEDDHQQLP